MLLLLLLLPLITTSQIHHCGLSKRTMLWWWQWFFKESFLKNPKNAEQHVSDHQTVAAKRFCFAMIQILETDHSNPMMMMI
jgi:hypothetical protein